MSPTPGNATADLQQVIGGLQRQLAVAQIERDAAQRLLTERTAERDESEGQKAALAEVLQIINSSRGDVTPVFDVMLQKATLLCEAAFGQIALYDGKFFRFVAVHGALRDAGSEHVRDPHPPSYGITWPRLIAGETTVHIVDVAETDLYQRGHGAARRFVDVAGGHTLLTAALHKDGVLLGGLTVYRQEKRPFTAKQIALLQNFAAQAVIAMENARLLSETREALEQQTATAEVLGVINSSPGDLAPVFEALVDRALKLCNVPFGGLWTYDGGQAFPAALRGVSPAMADFFQRPIRLMPGGWISRLIEGTPFIHISDIHQDLGYIAGHVGSRAVHDLGNFNSTLMVPLRKEGAFVGLISIYGYESRPFTDKQIALLQNFAAQAVIAMENARLITETREALEQQTATAEVLGVINRSPGNLTPVFDALLERAVRLCDFSFSVLWIYDGTSFRAQACHAVPTAYADFLATRYATPGSAFAQLLAGADIAQFDDVAADNAYGSTHPLAALGGARTYLAVALRKEGVLFGVISAFRQEVRPFSEKQVALLQNFAQQAVIAMENARLITETREALEQQTATAEVLGVINSSPGDLAPVFDAILEKASTLCDTAFGTFWGYDGERFHLAASRGASAALLDLQREPRAPGPFDGRLLRGEDVINVTDIVEGESFRAGNQMRKALVELGGARSYLMVALRKERSLLGYFSFYRREVRSFSEREMALLQNFAAQAVIAIENARLLNEIRQRQAELRVTFDNMPDGVAMFDEDLRLAACNRNFQQIADLPESLLADRPTYAEYLGILTDRGELDIGKIDQEISRRLEDTGQELRLERTRPNGQVIEVRRNAVPDGGFVLIYSDVTERKRSEAEIRAARDAAEAAYADLKAAQASLVQAEKMASLGQLTAGIAHEIKNPLNFVNNFAGLSVELLDELKDTAAPALATLEEDKRADIDDTMAMLTGNLKKIAEHGRRADNIVKSMLEHSRGVSGERREVNLNNLVEEALNLAYHGARAQDQSFNVTLERDYAPALKPIDLAPQEITRVFLNLFGNGFYAANTRAKANGDAGYRPTVRVVTHEAEDGVEVKVRDNGTGIPPEIRDKLFQPFFTTKPTGEGTGLGLSISYDIVTQQHGGTITVDSEPGTFTEFTVRLPRH